MRERDFEGGWVRAEGAVGRRGFQQLSHARFVTGCRAVTRLLAPADEGAEAGGFGVDSGDDG